MTRKQNALGGSVRRGRVRRVRQVGGARACGLLAAVLSLQAGAWLPSVQAGEPAPTSEAAPQATGETSPAPADSSKKKAKKPKPAISGYIQFYYKTRLDRSGDQTTEPDVFRFGRVKVKVAGEAKPGLTYVVEIDPRSPQIEGVMRDCYLQWEFHAGQRLRFGQMKTPFGWENRTSTTDLFTINRTEVGELLGRGLTLRDIGVGLFGHIPLGNGFRIEDEATVTNGAGLSAQADDDHRKNVFGRLGGRWKRDSTTLWLGVSGATGTINEPDDPGPPPQPGVSFDFSRFGGDVEVDMRHLFAVAEYAQGNEKASVSGEGGILSAWYILMAGKTSLGVGPVIRYDVFDSDFKRWTVGGYSGLPGEGFRSIVTYEVIKEGDLRHDDRILAMLQVLF